MRVRILVCLALTDLLSSCGSNGHITEQEFVSLSDEESQAIQLMRETVDQVRYLLDDPAIGESEKEALRAALSEARTALNHYVDLRSRGSTRAYVIAGIQMSSAGILADDASGVGLANDVLLLPLGLAAIATYVITDAKVSADKLGRAWNDTLDSIGKLGTTVDHVVAMTASGNVADTGIMAEVQDLLGSMGLAASRENICKVLQILLEKADDIGDRQKTKRIQTTQKAKRCRGSRHSRE